MNESSDTTPVIDVRNLTYWFKVHKALDDVTFRVQPQDLHGFVGPNGAGKTTTLKLICTLLRPQAGTIRVFGHDVVGEVNLIRRRIGFMPDQFSMYRQMTVFEYLDFFGAAYGLSVEQRNRVIGDVMSLTDMEGRQHDLVNSLSRGMQQRVSLARVLVNDPDVLLLDEPASGLDPRARIELMQILQELRRMGKTIFISSHILSELAELCDSVTIIDRGRIKYSGPMARLLDRGDERPSYRLTLGGEQNGMADRLRGLPGVTDVEQIENKPEYRVTYDWTETDSNSLLKGILEFGLPVLAFVEEKKHLNQAFLDLTERGIY